MFWLKRYCGGESKEVSATKQHHAKGEIIVKGETHKRIAHFSLGLLKWQMHWPDLRQLQMGGALVHQKVSGRLRETVNSERHTWRVTAPAVEQRAVFLSVKWGPESERQSVVGSLTPSPSATTGNFILTVADHGHGESPITCPQWLLRGQWRVSSGRARGSKQLVMGYENEQPAQVKKRTQEAKTEGKCVGRDWGYGTHGVTFFSWK